MFTFVLEWTKSNDKTLIMKNYFQPKNMIKSFLFFAFFSLSFVVNLNSPIGFFQLANAQTEQAASNDTSSLNSAQKSVFGELKKAASENKNTKQSLLMIALVIAVVLLAMFLAFRGGEESKTQSFTRTPKKQI